VIALAIQENLVEGATAAERMETARAAGFDGLEVRDAAPERVPELAAAGGPVTTACPELDGWLGDFGAARRRRAIDGLRRQLDGIAALGGRGVVTPAAWGMFTRRLPPFDEPPRTPEQDREVLLEGLAELGSRAAEAGAWLLLEPLNRYEDHMVNTVGAAAELAAATGSPAVRVLADTYHMNIEEDDPCAALRAAGDRLGAVHLSDSNRHQPGAGHVPFAAVLGTLREIGFDGVCSVECRLRGEPAEAVRECGAYLRGLLDAAAA
jgi:sugar phosphate isomerase/epimerase